MQIDCQFERLDGFLYALPGSEFNDLSAEHDAARRAGVVVEYLDLVPGLSFDSGPCVRYKQQAQFHLLKYLAGLAGGVEKGGQIFCHTRALSVEGDDMSQLVKTTEGTIRAQRVLIATKTPFNNRVVMHTKQAAYRAYVVGLKVPKGSVPRILLWDTGDPYYYVRLESPQQDDSHDILIVGGADHKVGQDDHPEHRYAEIERWAMQHFPMATTLTYYRWSGTVMEPADGLTFLGRKPMDDKNVFVISGDSGNGMTHCTIGAMLVKNLILGAENPWASIYDPARKATYGHSFSQYVSEQANTMAQYLDWLVKGEVESVREIQAGQGAIVRDGTSKLAVFRDEQGELHSLSAKCPHLGGVVHWNSAEQSWDCPCHGSRFDVQGKVLNGPDATGLSVVAIEDEVGI